MVKPVKKHRLWKSEWSVFSRSNMIRLMSIASNSDPDNQTMQLKKVARDGVASQRTRFRCRITKSTADRPGYMVSPLLNKQQANRKGQSLRTSSKNNINSEISFSSKLMYRLISHATKGAITKHVSNTRRCIFVSATSRYRQKQQNDKSLSFL